jgi:hypothetical protein
MNEQKTTEFRPIMTRLIFALLFLTLWPAAAQAHTDEYFATHPTPHGGQMRMAGPYHFELVVGKDTLALYVTDHSGTRVDTAGGSAKVIITSGKKKRYVVILSPAGDNALKGAGEFKLARSSSASVLVALPGQELQRAKFTLGARGKAAKKPRRHR